MKPPLTSRSKSQLVRQRWMTFGSMFVGWSFYYLSRKCFISTMGELRLDRSFTLDQLGTISSGFSFSYGISKFLSAILSDMASPRLMFCAGLGLCGVCVVVFPLSSSATLCCVIWCIVGLVQGFGWPACAKLLKTWYPPESVGTWWSVLSSSGSIAAAISPLLITFISQFTSWELCYYLIGGIACLLSLIFLVTITDTPEKVSSFDHLLADTRKKPSGSAASWLQLVTSVELLTISLIYFLLYVIKVSVSDWGILYFTDHARMTQASGTQLLIL